MKKAASALTALVMAASFQATCSAMQFQQPVFLGYSLAQAYILCQGMWWVRQE